MALVADEFEANLELFVSRFLSGVLGRVGPVRPELSPETEAAVSASALAVGRDLIARLRNGAELPPEPPADTARLARLWARNGYGLAGVVDAHLVGQEVFWEQFNEVTEHVTADPDVRWEVAKVAHARLAGYTQRMSEQFRRIHDCELELTAVQDADRRAASVNRVLAGDHVDCADVGYDLECEHLALIADGCAANLLPLLARRARRDLLQVGCPDGLTWAWLGGSTSLRSGELDDLAAWQRDHDGRIAFGEMASGVEGFRSSHEMAIEAWTVGQGGPERVIRFADVALPVALLRDASLAHLFINRELGALGATDSRATTLRQTLRVYLEHRQSVSTTAAMLGHDRKTIQRRLATVEGILPTALNERSAEVRIALRLVDAVGQN
jgi:hypothetical protein